MKKEIWTLFIIISTISCIHEKQRLTATFNKIDISRCDGWSGIYSVSIDSTRNFILKTLHGTENPKYFKGTIDDSIYNKITVFADSVRKTKYDTLYQPNCHDCPSYKVIIDTKNGRQSVHKRGIHNLGALDSLINIFTAYSKTTRLIEIDTNFEYESMKNFLLPVMETVKFSPPIVK